MARVSMVEEGPDPMAGAFPGRLEGVRRAAQSEGMDAIVASSPENVYWLSGALVHTQALIRRRQAMVVLPADRPPSLIVCAIERGLAERMSQLPGLATYQEFEESAIQQAVASLVSAGMAEGRIGIETTHLPVEDYQTIREALPQARFVPCDTLLQLLRSRKGAAEQEAMGFAARALDKAIAAAASTARLGISEEELGARIAGNALALGGGGFRAAVGLVAAGQNLRVSHHVAGPKRLERGELLRVGCRAVYKGYHLLVARTAAVGRVSDKIMERYRKLASGHKDLLASLVPGAVGGEIYERACAYRAALGLEVKTAHVGHGIGVEFQELPRLRRDSPDELGLGQVLLAVSVAPDPEAGNLYIEEMVSIGAEGALPPSNYASPDEPLVIDA